MIGTIFRRDLHEATGRAWEEWAVELQRTVGASWSHEAVKDHICDTFGVTEEWGEWLALLYGQLTGRVPVGVTKDAGVNIGVRRTSEAAPEQIWRFLTSPHGLQLWIGNAPAFSARKGFEFESEEGVSGKLSVVVPNVKLRMTWKRREWDNPSRLQIYLLRAKSGKTTIAFHQEMLDDVYMRELMRRHWEERLHAIIEQVEAER